MVYQIYCLTLEANGLSTISRKTHSAITMVREETIQCFISEPKTHDQNVNGWI